MTTATEVLSGGGAPPGAESHGPEEALATRARGGSRLFGERFSEDRAAMGALVVICFLILTAFVGGPIAQKVTGHGNNAIFSDVNPHGPTTLDDFGLPKGPNKSFWFG